MKAMHTHAYFGNGYEYITLCMDVSHLFFVDHSLLCCETSMNFWSS